MWGLIIALLYAALVYFLGKPNTPPEVFLSATNFLFWWYVATSAIWGVIIVLIAFGIWSLGTIGGAAIGGIIGGVLGSLGGAALSALILVLFAVKAGCYIAGAYLLHQALIVTPTGNPEWDTMKLVFAGILLFVGVMLSRKSSSSSSSQKE